MPLRNQSEAFEVIANKAAAMLVEEESQEAQYIRLRDEWSETEAYDLNFFGLFREYQGYQHPEETERQERNASKVEYYTKCVAIHRNGIYLAKTFLLSLYPSVCADPRSVYMAALEREIARAKKKEGEHYEEIAEDLSKLLNDARMNKNAWPEPTNNRRFFQRTN